MLVKSGSSRVGISFIYRLVCYLNNELYTLTRSKKKMRKDNMHKVIRIAWRIPGTGGAWWAAIYGVAQSQTWLKRLSSSSSSSRVISSNQKKKKTVVITTIHGPFMWIHYSDLSFLNYLSLTSLSSLRIRRVSCLFLLLPKPSTVTTILQWKWSHSVVSDSLRLRGL